MRTKWVELGFAEGVNPRALGGGLRLSRWRVHLYLRFWKWGWWIMVPPSPLPRLGGSGRND